ncbi:hypothetical protein H9P43_003685 [Blastocladiella emersonii ATCC 22665]|nr:hypothetical protein H9P43_003685 [Blastocladiella emersonii ATCC 22665]
MSKRKPQTTAQEHLPPPLPTLISEAGDGDLPPLMSLDEAVRVSLEPPRKTTRKPRKLSFSPVVVDAPPPSATLVRAAEPYTCTCKGEIRQLRAQVVDLSTALANVAEFQKNMAETLAALQDEVKRKRERADAATAAANAALETRIAVLENVQNPPPSTTVIEFFEAGKAPPLPPLPAKKAAFCALPPPEQSAVAKTPAAALASAPPVPALVEPIPHALVRYDPAKRVTMPQSRTMLARAAGTADPLLPYAGHRNSVKRAAQLTAESMDRFEAAKQATIDAYSPSGWKKCYVAEQDYLRAHYRWELPDGHPNKGDMDWLRVPDFSVAWDRGLWTPAVEAVLESLPVLDMLTVLEQFLAHFFAVLDARKVPQCSELYGLLLAGSLDTELTIRALVWPEPSLIDAGAFQFPLIVANVRAAMQEPIPKMHLKAKPPIFIKQGAGANARALASTGPFLPRVKGLCDHLAMDYTLPLFYGVARIVDADDVTDKEVAQFSTVHGAKLLEMLPPVLAKHACAMVTAIAGAEGILPLTLVLAVLLYVGGDSCMLHRWFQNSGGPVVDFPIAHRVPFDYAVAKGIVTFPEASHQCRVQ